MIHTLTGIIVAAAAGVFYKGEQYFLASMCIGVAVLLAIKYFDFEKEHKKSVK